MPHGAFEEMLAWVDGELSPARAAALDGHVDGCPSCATLLADVRSASACFGGAVRVLDAPARAGSTADVRRRAIRWKLRRTASVAAAVTLLLTGAGYALAQTARGRAWLAGRTSRQEGPPAAQTVPSSGAALLSVVSPDSLDILIGERRDSLALRVVRSARRRLSVEAGETSPPVQVELGAGRLRVEPGPVHDLTLVIPRGTRARIISGGGVVLDLSRASPEAGIPADSVVTLRLPPPKGR